MRRDWPVIVAMGVLGTVAAVLAFLVGLVVGYEVGCDACARVEMDPVTISAPRPQGGQR